MESTGGVYTFLSDGKEGVCGFYLISSPDEIIEIEFIDFEVDCESGGLVAVVDGWELNGNFFPSESDHHLSMKERYHTLCGKEVPKRIYLASQNAALIQNYIPVPGEGFTVRVKYLPNPQPCNVLSMFQEGVYTMKNYGEKRNCSFSAIYPEKVRFLSIDVGSTGLNKERELEFGVSDQCESQKGGDDYVEILGGNSFALSSLNRFKISCGLQSSADKHSEIVGCQHTVIRMVSSGQFYNTITFLYTPPSNDEFAMADPNKCMN
ncbi:hypothetical protein FSP39_019604 [Pinctada imbricata]|uniref:Corticotropin-releasing factor-binding protein n=1 Tax=Pinctada imbricata TaxID=66713 RepID=A0AA88Y5H7_PINIB|nr:hypothetical protein FSP39_019604 [Pinctada imbricata]